MELTSLSKRRLFTGVMVGGLAALTALIGFDSRGDAQGPSNAQSVVIIRPTTPPRMKSNAASSARRSSTRLTE